MQPAIGQATGATRPPGPEAGSGSRPGRRSPAFAFFCAYAFFIVYATLIPFQFLTSPEELHAKQDYINWDPSHLVTGEPTPIMDLVSNVFFFVPLGFVGFHAQRRRGVASALVRSTLSGCALSIGVEILQFFTPTRNPATSDVLTNTLGAFAGALLALFFRMQLERRLRRRARAWATREPLLPVVVGQGVLVVAGALVPFDLAPSISWLKRAVRTAVLDPRPGPLDWADLAGAALPYAVLAGLALHVVSRVRREPRALQAAAVWGLAVLLASALEVVQLFVRSRVTSTRDLLAAAAGAALGCLVSLALGTGRRARYGWAFVGAAALLGLALGALAPFRFDLDLGSMRERVTWRTLVPYSSYYFKATVSAVADFLEALLAYVPLGFVLTQARERRRPPRLRAAGPVVVWCTAYALALEILQLGVARRYPEVSDVLTAALGAALGAYAWRWFAFLAAASHPASAIESPPAIARAVPSPDLETAAPIAPG